jgi:methionyl-tRNA formyltransferase
VSEVADVGADLGIVVAFGRIIKPDVLARLEMVNLHFSLLPRWRGAAPVERAILAGDPVTGVCIMRVEEGLDTGGVFRHLSVEIGPHESARELTARLAEIGAALMVKALREGLGDPVQQQGEVTYASKLDPSELRLDFELPARYLERVVRVGRAWTTWRHRRLLVLEAHAEDTDWRPTDPDGASGPSPGSPEVGSIGEHGLVSTGSGVLRLLVVQPEGRPPLQAPDWIRGARPERGERLGE